MVCVLFAQNQSCPVNINFSSGALTHWFAYTGTFQQNSPRDVASKQNYDSISPYPSGTYNTQTLPEYLGGGGQGVQVLTSKYNDVFGGFETIPTINGYNYKYSVLLGSTSTNSSPGGFFRGIGYQVDVPAGTGPYTMTYAYAMVLENGNHESIQQPLASATLYTNNGIIDCASPKYFLPTSGGTLDEATAIRNGFKQSNVPSPSVSGFNNTTPYRVWTKDWTEVTFDLQAYRGQKVTLVFTAENCVPKGHFAYAYFAIRNECNGLTISGPPDACQSGIATYSIPSLDGASYIWTVPNGWVITSGIGTNIITVTPGNQSGTITARAVNSCADLSANLFVTSNTPTIAGSISGNNIVCEGINNSPITLTGNNGSVVKWISSTDNGQSWNDVNSTSAVYNAQNLNVNTLYKALVQKGTQCSIDSTNSVLITVNNKSKGGDLYPSLLPICLGQNQNTTLQLNNSNGNVVNWQYSYDSTLWNNVTPTHTNKSYDVLGIFSTVKYRVIVKNGVCPVDTSLIASIYFYNAPFPRATAYPDSSNICFGSAATLNTNITVGTNYSWNTNTILSSGNGSVPNLPYTIIAKVAPSKNTNYTLSIKNAGCPAVWTNTFKVNVIPPVVVDAGHDTTVVINQPLQLNATVTDSSTVSFNWSPSTGLNNPNINNPVAILNGSVDSIKYTVRATLNSYGCYGEDFVWVKVFKTDPDIFVPSAFTPNKDGLNDIIKPIPVGIATLNYFNIYNRWGQLLYNTAEIGKGWDGYLNGTAQPAGTYIYVTEGIDYKGKTIFKKGTVVLIR
jgi:gliding motility-associated-like protein